MIKTIIFDIGGVVTNRDFKLLYANFAKIVGVSYEFINSYHDDNYTNLILGHYTFEKFLQDVRDGGADENLDLRSVWIKEGIKYKEINFELLDLIKKMRKNYTVGTLTNLTPTRLILDEVIELYSNFDYSLLSCVEGMKKPDLEFYMLAIKTAGVRPEEALFIDDRKSCIEAAKKVGMKTILYKYPGNSELLKKLGKLGVKV